MKKKRSLDRENQVPYIFEDWYEEKKVLEYLANMIKSEMLHLYSHSLFFLAIDLLGEKVLKEFLLGNAGSSRDTGSDRDGLTDSEELKRDFLRSAVTGMIASRQIKLSRLPESALEIQMKSLKQTYKLSDVDSEVFTLIYLAERVSFFGDFLKSINSSEVSLFFALNYFPMILRIERWAVMNALTEGQLAKHEIVITSPCIKINHKILKGMEEIKNSHVVAYPVNKKLPFLSLSDFNISPDELRVIDMLMKGEKGFNLLIYGEADSGKTTFAKVLAKEYNKPLLMVDLSETEDIDDARKQIYRIISQVESEKSLLLIDYADDIFDARPRLFRERHRTWLKDVMESDRQIIWIVRNPHLIESELARRFIFSIKLKKTSIEQKLKVLDAELDRLGLKIYLSEEELKGLCRNHDTERLLEVFSMVDFKNQSREIAMEQIKTILENQERLISGKFRKNIRSRDFRYYTLSCLNCSENPQIIINALRSYEDMRRREISGDSVCSMLLYGLPGTGKTEFVYYLGNVLGKDIVLKRASDIYNPYIGITEKNIALAFQKAAESDSILFFDEADTFLFPRKNAWRSWEISFTNEILTQLENFSGIVVFATNHIEGLDSAALRRFRFKIEFRPLRPEGIVELYERSLKPLVPEGCELTDYELKELKEIENLTPGDFATVRVRYLYIEPSMLSHRILIQALKEEVKYKQNKKTISGFGSA